MVGKSGERWGFAQPGPVNNRVGLFVRVPGRMDRLNFNTVAFHFRASTTGTSNVDTSVKLRNCSGINAGNPC